jgi:hypothetical protein
MKTTIFSKNEKELNKSLTKLFTGNEITKLTNSELNHIRGGEGEGSEEKSPIKL